MVRARRLNGDVAIIRAWRDVPRTAPWRNEQAVSPNRVTCAVYILAILFIVVTIVYVLFRAVEIGY
jgi:hypothetical protein